MIKKLFAWDFARKKYSSLRFLLILLSNYFYDFKRFYLFSATNSMYRTKVRHQGRITAHYHVLEKGLSLASPRVGFGKQIVSDLVALLNNYQQKYGLDDVGQVALNVLFTYYQFNLEHGLENKELYQEITKLKDKVVLDKSFASEGGVIPVSKDEIEAATCIDFKKFANTRHSVRNFADEEVSLSLIKEAIAIATKTPSVCNRQTWKVYTFSDEELKKKVLSHQNGNRGFGHQASKILIVTSDLDLFISAAERNQCFIDGGMFAMSLIYALHSLGLGTCCLNWSVTRERDLALRKDAKIDHSESIIMMIAVGNLPDNFSVANSSRKPVEEILVLK